MIGKTLGHSRRLVRRVLVMTLEGSRGADKYNSLSPMRKYTPRGFLTEWHMPAVSIVLAHGWRRA
jgi:hypothetical protein